MSDNEDLIGENFEENQIQVFEEVGNEESSEQVPADNEGGEDDANKHTVKPKRVIRNPQPKLNAETLKGKRGLTALPSYFERVKFKGKGYEQQDLSVILKTYEYWCHRLFPKYPFDECLAKIEHLGNKKPVVTHIKKIRADLVFEDEPIINDDHDSDTEQIPINPFDLLQASNVEQPSAPLANTQISSIEPPVGVSEEQMERMRLNKERAERIRREKLRQTTELAQSLTENSILEIDDYSEAAITNVDGSQVHENSHNSKKKEMSVDFICHGGGPDLPDARTQTDSLQLSSNNPQMSPNQIKENWKVAEPFVSQDVETNSREQNTLFDTLKASTSTEFVHQQKSSNFFPKGPIDSDEDL